MARTRADVDYYAALGVTPAASEDEIRRTFRRLALQWHPDRNPGDPRAEERFKEISEAYAVLMDPAKRRAWEAARRGGAPGGFGPSREDVFRDLFNDPRASAIFEDLARELSRLGLRVERSDFERTLFGGRVVVTGNVFVVSPWRVLGRVARTALGALGRRLLGLPVRSQEATRSDVTFPLRLTAAEADRGGRKRVTLHRADGDDEVLVTIPPGVRAGTRLRLRGKGRARGSGPRGDAYLVVEVAG
ncbi:MAG TPA: DnaJ domain-containing protein [Methylomirabilota bacterium]|nr:DnaJ domain-containing protein [Methylomirabilota bacterium]